MLFSLSYVLGVIMWHIEIGIVVVSVPNSLVTSGLSNNMLQLARLVPFLVNEEWKCKILLCYVDFFKR